MADIDSLHSSTFRYSHPPLALPTTRCADLQRAIDGTFARHARFSEESRSSADQPLPRHILPEPLQHRRIGSRLSEVDRRGAVVSDHPQVMLMAPQRPGRLPRVSSLRPRLVSAKRCEVRGHRYAPLPPTLIGNSDIFVHPDGPRRVTSAQPLASLTTESDDAVDAMRCRPSTSLPSLQLLDTGLADYFRPVFELRFTRLRPEERARRHQHAAALFDCLADINPAVDGASAAPAPAATTITITNTTTAAIEPLTIRLTLTPSLVRGDRTIEFSLRAEDSSHSTGSLAETSDR